MMRRLLNLLTVLSLLLCVAVCVLWVRALPGHRRDQVSDRPTWWDACGGGYVIGGLRSLKPPRSYCAVVRSTGNVSGVRPGGVGMRDNGMTV